MDRLADNQSRQAFEVAFDASGLATPLRDSDILRIYATLPAYKQTVTLGGNVANPGRFSWHADMHLSDLILIRIRCSAAITGGSATRCAAKTDSRHWSHRAQLQPNEHKYR